MHADRAAYHDALERRDILAQAELLERMARKAVGAGDYRAAPRLIDEALLLLWTERRDVSVRERLTRSLRLGQLHVGVLKNVLRAMRS